MSMYHQAAEDAAAILRAARAQRRRASRLLADAKRDSEAMLQWARQEPAGAGRAEVSKAMAAVGGGVVGVGCSWLLPLLHSTY